MRQRMILLLLCLHLLALPAHSANEMPPAQAADWVTQWLVASSSSDYQGSLVVTQGGNMNTFALWHRAAEEPDTPREERLRRQDGPLFEVIRTDDRITCLHAPGSNTPEDHELPGSPFAQLMHLTPELMVLNYQVETLPNERVAGRDAEVFQLTTRHNEQRLIHRIWLDKETQILLRHSKHSPEGVVLEEVRFVVFEPGLTDMPISIASRFRDWFWHRYEHSPAAQTAGADAVWQLSPPSGFQLEVAEVRDDGWYQLWSDGLVEFSLMVEPAPETAEPMSDQRGSSVLVSAIHGDWLVVVVGDVPEAVAYEVLDRVHWQYD